MLLFDFHLRNLQIQQILRVFVFLIDGGEQRGDGRATLIRTRFQPKLPLELLVAIGNHSVGESF